MTRALGGSSRSSISAQRDLRQSWVWVGRVPQWAGRRNLSQSSVVTVITEPVQFAAERRVDRAAGHHRGSYPERQGFQQQRRDRSPASRCAIEPGQLGLRPKAAGGRVDRGELGFDGSAGSCDLLSGRVYECRCPERAPPCGRPHGGGRRTDLRASRSARDGRRRRGRRRRRGHRGCLRGGWWRGRSRESLR